MLFCVVLCEKNITFAAVNLLLRVYLGPIAQLVSST